MYKRVWVSLSTAISLFGLPAVSQEVGKDVPASHWAYGAMQDLAAKGLIKGYPPDARFLGGRSLTRYEMATVIQRVLERMDEIAARSQKADGGDATTKADIQKMATSLSEIHDLTDEFKKELLVIGSDLQKANDEIAALKTASTELAAKVKGLSDKVTAADKRAADAKTASDKAQHDVDGLKKSTDDELAKKVEVTNSSSDLAKKYHLRVFGDVQTWYLNPGGGTTGGQSGSSVPPGRNYGGGVGDTFRIRRAELGFTGNINPRADFYFLFDLGKIPNLSSSTSNVNGSTVVTAVGANASNDILQDAWTGYQLTPQLRIELGAQKTGMSEEGNRSSTALYTIERSIMNGLPTNAGRVGYVRDTGAVMRYKTAQGNINVGFWNDNGPAQDTVDTDRTKFLNIVGNYTGLRNVTAGLFGGANVDNVHPKPSRDRAGYTFIYQNKRHFFETEGAYTLDQSATTGITGRSIGLGGYGLYAYSLNRKWQLVGKIDEWNPSVHGSVAGGVMLGSASNHNLKEYTLGVNYLLSGNNNSKIQFNWIDEDTEHNGNSFWGVRRQMLLTNYSAAF